MENNIKERVDEYLKLFDSIKARMGEERLAMSILQEVNKDVRMDQIRNERSGNGNGHSEDKPATQRQLDYLERLGIKAPAGITKKRASELIDAALEKESDEDSLSAALANVKLPWHSVNWN